MAQITTHVLDTSQGRPAVNVAVVLEQRRAARSWSVIARAQTDEDGRARLADVPPGSYRITFNTAGYFGEGAFFTEAMFTFEVREDGHYHVPLLATPYGCTTYRGS